ncbi:TetR/AcrR family transcriptional regulator [Brevundimonas sp.]|uniref:TetR/AcrR family transcriptional regulator n=1 Tax=Brevundimonas sp. TaxID=1871086 RepID=UPI002737E383|nr:TetR/AcrR family transcriptional regulator [Brevundimonas sp.]
MSGNSVQPRRIDQRVARTRGRLASALIALGQTRNIDDIGVGDLVRAAGVSRSTFYAHYLDRDDFLGRSFAGMIAICDELARREGLTAHVLPVAHVVTHIAGNEAFSRRVGPSRSMEVMLAAGERSLRRIAETNLAALAPRLPPEERRQTAAFLAGAFVGQLRLWLQNDFRTAPQTLIVTHRRLAAAVLAALDAAPTTPFPLDRKPAHVP